MGEKRNINEILGASAASAETIEPIALPRTLDVRERKEKMLGQILERIVEKSLGRNMDLHEIQNELRLAIETEKDNLSGLDTEIMEGYINNLESLYKEVKVKGNDPNEDSINLFTRRGGFRDLVKAATARLILQTGFEMLSSLDKIQARLAKVDEYINGEVSGAVSDGENEYIEVKQTLQSLQQIKESQNRGRAISREVVESLPETYGLKSAVQKIVGRVSN